jgi:hypothetical protein
MSLEVLYRKYTGARGNDFAARGHEVSVSWLAPPAAGGGGSGGGVPAGVRHALVGTDGAVLAEAEAEQADQPGDAR